MRGLRIESSDVIGVISRDLSDTFGLLPRAFECYTTPIEYDFLSSSRGIVRKVGKAATSGRDGVFLWRGRDFHL